MVKNDLLSPLLGLVIFSFSYADYGLHPRLNIFHSFGVPFPYGYYQGLRLTPKPLSVFFHAFGVSKKRWNMLPVGNDLVSYRKTMCNHGPTQGRSLQYLVIIINRGAVTEKHPMPLN